MLARPEFDPHTDEIVGDTPDLDLARKARSIGPEFTGWRSRVKARPDIEFGDTSARRCGHWSGSRLVASDVPGSDRGVRQEPPYPPSTAQDSMSLGDNVGESGEARSFRTESVTTWNSEIVFFYPSAASM